MAKKSVQRRYFLLIPLLILAGAVVLGLAINKNKERSLTSTCSTFDYSGLFDSSAKTAVYNGEEIGVPVASATTDQEVLGVTSADNRWIEVDLSEQKLKAWDGNSLFLETPVSTGLPWWPTPTGEFRIWVKLRYTKMEGGQGRNYYYLPNVPYVMFFENGSVPGWRGYSLHGTYWHSDFGNRRSHGCVNLPTPIAEKLYYWVTPNLPEGKGSIFADAGNPGTRIVIHD